MIGGKGSVEVSVLAEAAAGEIRGGGEGTEGTLLKVGIVTLGRGGGGGWVGEGLGEGLREGEEE